MLCSFWELVVIKSYWDTTDLVKVGSPKGFQSCLCRPWSSLGFAARRGQQSVSECARCLRCNEESALDFKCVHFKQKWVNPLRYSLPKSDIKHFVSLCTQGSGCITALMSSPVRGSPAACRAQCCMMCLTPWFKQHSAFSVMLWYELSLGMAPNILTVLISLTYSGPHTPNIYAVCTREVYWAGNALLHARIYITNTQTCTCFCLWFSRFFLVFFFYPFCAFLFCILFFSILYMYYVVYCIMFCSLSPLCILWYWTLHMLC